MAAIRQHYGFAQLIFKFFQLRGILIWSLGMSMAQGTVAQAQTYNAAASLLPENVDLIERTTSVSTLHELQLKSDLNAGISAISRNQSFEQSPFLIAAPENFNPGLRLPPPPPPQPIQPPVILSPEEEINRPPFLELNSLEIDFRGDYDNFNQRNQIVEPTLRFRLANGQMLLFRSGFNTFDQANLEEIINIPLQVGWQGRLGGYNLQVLGGVDVFSRLPTAFRFNAKLDTPPIFVNLDENNQLTSALFVSAVVEQGAYKFNAETLDNQITALRLGPSIYWQINRHASLFSLYRFGFYNDGNYEQQSFSRLERKFGQFFLAANLFTWRYNLDPQNGYFSPPDFLVYNGELGWEGDIFQFLRCRLFGNFGQQRLEGKFDEAYTYQSRCTVRISPNVELDVGYGFSNVINQKTGGSTFNNRSFTSQLRVQF